MSRARGRSAGRERTAKEERQQIQQQHLLRQRPIQMQRQQLQQEFTRQSTMLLLQSGTRLIQRQKLHLRSKLVEIGRAGCKSRPFWYNYMGRTHNRKR